jgi:D-inositol-3-phosphate glycosyltransferase
VPATRSGGRGALWGAALLRRFRRASRVDGPESTGLGLDPEKTSPDERRTAWWKARLDLPREGAVLGRSFNVVSGWAVHEWRHLRGVLITVDGRPKAFVTSFSERRDVVRRWGSFPTADRSGWTAMVDFGDADGPDVVVSAYAFLEPRRHSPDGERQRLGPVRHIGTVRCQVRSGEGPSGLPTGYFHESDFVTAGYVHVTGHIQSLEDVATVELMLDGERAGLARATPGEELDTNAVSIVSTHFEGVLHVAPNAASVSVTAVVTLISGYSFELKPWHVDVHQALVRHGPDADRMALVRDRSAGQLAALARGTPAQEPRVLVATADLGLGGGQLYLHELMLRLARSGMRFALTSPRSGPLTDELEGMGVPVLVTGPPQVQDPEAYEAQVRDIGAFAVQHGCTAVLANIVTSFTGADAGLRLGLPLTWAIHESYPFGQFWTEAFGPDGAHPYVVDRARLSLGAASRVVFEATQTLRFYEELLAPGAGVVVPYGVDLEEIARFRDSNDRDELRARLGISPDTRALLCMGTIEPRKGQLNLAQAFGHSAALRGADVQLIFVGAVRGRPYADALSTYVDGLGDPRIRIEPVQPDIHRWYHACDVLVCASDVESLPRSMLEAMAFGRPVASTAVFGIPELVEDGVSGFLCRDRDLAALRGMLERVADTGRDDLVAMGARARGVVTTRHDPSVYAGYYLAELTRHLQAD